MSSINITNARKDPYRIVEAVNDSHDPIHITGKNRSAVLIGEDDWRSIEGTRYLPSIPGMSDSIIDGMRTPIDDLASEP